MIKLRYRNHINDNNNVQNIDECAKLINHTHHKLIGKGSQGTVFKISTTKCGSVVVKKYHKQHHSTILQHKSIEHEINVTNEIKKLIDNDICPNFIYMFGYSLDNRYIMMEYADGDMGNFLQTTHSDDVYLNSNFQIYVALLTLHKILRYNHNDMCFPNIFYKKITNEYDYFQYNINGHIFNLPNDGYLFMIADFGMTEPSDSNKSKNDDLDKLCVLYKIKLLAMNLKIYYGSLGNLMKSIDTTDKKFTDFYNNLIKTTEQRNIFYNVIYYCIENNMIDYEEIKHKLKYKMMPDYLIDILVDLYCSKVDEIQQLNKTFIAYTAQIDETKYRIKKFTIVF